MTNYIQGGFELEALILTNQFGESIDLMELSDGFRMYESIYEKFITADITLKEGLSLPKNMRLSGQENVRISLRQLEGNSETASKDFSIDKTLRLYSIKDVQKDGNVTERMELLLIDPRAFYVSKTRLRRVMRGSYDQMLQNILMQAAHFKAEEFVHWESTIPENQQVVCRGWRITDTIDYLVQSANISTNPSYRNGMFFYQTLNGGFTFKSIDSMFEQEFPIAFNDGMRATIVDSNEEALESPKGLNTAILSHGKPQLFDTLTGTVQGAYASSMKVYDPLTKIEKDVVFDLSETFKRGKHLSGEPMLTLDEDERTLTADNVTEGMTDPEAHEVDIDIPLNKASDTLILKPFNTTHVFDDSESLDESETFEGQKFLDNAPLERNSMIQILQQHTIRVSIPLRTDLSVGLIVALNIADQETSMNNESVVNDNRYLITDLALHANPVSRKGSLIMECVKESFAKKLSDIDSPRNNMDGPEEV